jgi:hypothetical protein
MWFLWSSELTGNQEWNVKSTRSNLGSPREYAENSRYLQDRVLKSLSGDNSGGQKWRCNTVVTFANSPFLFYKMPKKD